MIDSIPVHKGVTQNWAHESERVQTAESTLSCDVVLHEVWNPMSLDCEHIVLLPTIDPLLKVGFDGEIDSVCHMLRLSITVDFDDINIPFLEGINQFIEFVVVLFSLSLQLFFPLSYKLLEFRHIELFEVDFGRFFVLFPIFKSLLLGLLSFDFELFDFLLDHLVQLLLDLLLVQVSIQPLVLLAPEYEHSLWEFPCIGQKFDKGSLHSFLIDIIKIGIDENFVDSTENLFDYFHLESRFVELW